MIENLKRDWQMYVVLILFIAGLAAILWYIDAAFDQAQASFDYYFDQQEAKRK